VGIDLLDVSFRLEKRFAIRLVAGDFIDLSARRQPPDISAGDLITLVLTKRALPGGPPPPTDYLDRQIPCMTCRRGLRDLPRTAYCPHCGTSSAESQIWLGVCKVLEDTLGASPDQLHPNALLRRDLGAA
jgi:hypothetical protein